jgi:hypothetical protein
LSFEELKVANHEDCHCGFQDWSWEAKSNRKSRQASFSL